MRQDPTREELLDTFIAPLPAAVLASIFSILFLFDIQTSTLVVMALSWIFLIFTFIFKSFK